MLYRFKEDHFKKAFGGDFARIEATEKFELDPSAWKPKS
jgi:hypothetical protein